MKVINLLFHEKADAQSLEIIGVKLFEIFQILIFQKKCPPQIFFVFKTFFCKFTLFFGVPLKFPNYGKDFSPSVDTHP